MRELVACSLQLCALRLDYLAFFGGVSFLRRSCVFNYVGKVFIIKMHKIIKMILVAKTKLTKISKISPMHDAALDAFADM